MSSVQFMSLVPVRFGIDAGRKKLREELRLGALEAHYFMYLCRDVESA
jgi:hypothetical protein